MTAYDYLCAPDEEEEYTEHPPQPIMDPCEFEFSLADEPFVVRLTVLSPRTRTWNQYMLNDAWCSCPSRKPCYHREVVLQSCGGYAAVLTALLNSTQAQKGA